MITTCIIFKPQVLGSVTTQKKYRQNLKKCFCFCSNLWIGILLHYLINIWLHVILVHRFIILPERYGSKDIATLKCFVNWLNNTTLLCQGCTVYLSELLHPIVACVSEGESRVRYLAAEALFNVLKIARGATLAHFPLLFDALARLAADPEPQVRQGAELLDRLVKVCMGQR